MKNYWIHRFVAFVEVKISGKNNLDIINEFAKEQIFIKNVKRTKQDDLIFQIQVRDIKTLRKLVRKKGYKVRFMKRSGMPFKIKQLFKNKGILFGIFFFVVIIFLLSNMIWNIKIEGASQKTAQKIIKELDKENIKVGKFNFGKDDVDKLQKQLTMKIPDITWVGIKVYGSSYVLQVVEKKSPKKNNDTSSGELVASKKAYIKKTFIETGQLQVKKNQLVKKGDILVSGYIGNENNLIYVGAKGKVMGETWYQTTSTVPVNSTFEKLSGKSYRKTKLKVFNKNMPIWGFAQNKYKKTKLEKKTINFHFLKWKMPVEIVNTTKYEVKNTTQKRTFNEAMKLAIKNAQTDMKSKLPKGAKILKETILQKQVSNDKVIVTLHYKVLENIAVGVKNESENEFMQEKDFMGEN